MPLVVPGVTTQSGDRTEEWTNKLVGKKLHEEQNNETVSPWPFEIRLTTIGLSLTQPHGQFFAKTELPEKHRVIAPGQMVTRDFHEDRLNVHVDEEGTVSHVTYG